MDTPVASTALAELHLLLGRAFLAPVEPQFAAAFARDLPGDLEELAAGLPFDCAPTIAALRASVSALAPGELLQAYSALFLQPPRRASLEASVHLDGAAMGPTTLAVEARFASYGLRATESVRELPDHLARLLEFAGYLGMRAAAAADAHEAAQLRAAAGEFLGACVRPWVPALVVEVRAACDELGGTRAYQHLAELVAIAAWEGEGWRQDRREERPERAPRQARCGKCDAPYAEDAALKAVRRIMEKKGLPVAHLDLCGNCRGITEEASGSVEPPHVRMM